MSESDSAGALTRGRVGLGESTLWADPTARAAPTPMAYLGAGRVFGNGLCAGRRGDAPPGGIPRARAALAAVPDTGKELVCRVAFGSGGARPLPRDTSRALSGETVVRAGDGRLEISRRASSGGSPSARNRMKGVIAAANSAREWKARKSCDLPANGLASRTETLPI